jgi:hypothetical protein
MGSDLSCEGVTSRGVRGLVAYALRARERVLLVLGNLMAIVERQDKSDDSSTLMIVVCSRSNLALTPCASDNSGITAWGSISVIRHTESRSKGYILHP